MTNRTIGTVTAFLGDAQIASGSRDAVTKTLEERYSGDLGDIRVFDDATGRVTDLDYWDALESSGAPAKGRPRLGVKAREVTLLPRHWEWLAAQPGGASATLRRLVETASKGARSKRQRQDAVYHFITQACGDRPGYEEALRALYQDDDGKFAELVAAWPPAIGDYVSRLHRA